MKVGILTFHHTTNYGATLQAYALWKIIKQYGHDVEIIDYRPYKTAINYLGRLMPIKPIHGNYSKYKWESHFIPYLIQAWRMRRFLVSKMDLSKKKSYTTASLNNFSYQYDVVICGSDQVWNIKNRFRGGFEPSFFLDFVDNENCQKISYAPSFGQTKELGSHKQLISQLIGQFNHLSVRDNNSLRLIEQECNRTATKVLDPTFLNDFSEFKLIPKIKQEYILLYSITSYTAEQENQIKTLIESVPKLKNLLIVSLARPSKIANVNLITVDPEEWVGYFRNAAYVITGSYHGTIFSLKFKRDFTVFTRPDNVKIKDLLKSLSLESRIIDHQETCLFSQQSVSIDYDPVHETLEKKITSSKKYLVEALDVKKAETALRQAG
ncbi:MAG: polysaccharide pyruvyl transferase family protein [Xenococcus sp. MO_188.B8]|nr:polysaccharide pyruvyl transferase family protein [Xenococcus sp. MO_188.B8]